MAVTVTFRHMEPSAALKHHVEEKIHRITKFVRRSVEAHAVLSVNKHRHAAEITVVANGPTFIGHEETDDLYAAIDRAIDKIQRQMKKHCTKRRP